MKLLLGPRMSLEGFCLRLSTDGRAGMSEGKRLGEMSRSPRYVSSASRCRQSLSAVISCSTAAAAATTSIVSRGTLSTAAVGQ